MELTPEQRAKLQEMLATDLDTAQQLGDAMMAVVAECPRCSALVRDVISRKLLALAAASPDVVS